MSLSFIFVFLQNGPDWAGIIGNCQHYMLMELSAVDKLQPLPGGGELKKVCMKLLFIIFSTQDRIHNSSTPCSRLNFPIGD